MEKFLKKLRELPENKKKTILWVIVIFLGIVLFVFFIKNATQKINKLQGDYFSSETAGLQKNISASPAQDMGQAIKEIENIFKQNSSTNSPQDKNQNSNEPINQN